MGQAAGGVEQRGPELCVLVERPLEHARQWPTVEIHDELSLADDPRQRREELQADDRGSVDRERPAIPRSVSWYSLTNSASV